MVLTRIRWAVALLLASSACIHRAAPVKLAQPAKVAVAYVADPEQGGAPYDVPEAVKAAVAQDLAARNLGVDVVPFEQLAEPFARMRATERRFEVLAQKSQAPLLLLVETKPTFFALVSGRYRWVVQVKLTAQARGAAQDPTQRQFEQPVILVFDHQRGPQALEEAAPRIAENAGALFDDLLPSSPAPAALPAGPQTRALPSPGAIYFVMVDRFANGDRSNDADADLKDPDAFHGGDLQGVLDHLDELKALGVETVWLSPIFKMRTEKFFGHGAFHGYWVEDLREVEPRFGTKALLKTLSDELHRRGMKLVLDMVFNHVGPDTKLVQQHPDWFHQKGGLQNWEDAGEVLDHDVQGLPDLAQENPEVYAYLLNASRMWIDEVHPDGFRLDAVKHVPVAFWARFSRDIREHAGPGFLLIGELLNGDPKTLSRTMREGGFDALFDFPLRFAVADVFCRDHGPASLGAALSSDRMYDDASRLVTLVDNHDLSRITSECGGDLERVKRALFFTLTARGTPSLTFGTEAAQKGEKEPLNRGDMDFAHQPLKAFIQDVLALRAQHPSLVDGVPLLTEVAQDRFAYLRVSETEVALIALNRSAAPIRVDLPGARQPVTVLPGQMQIAFAPNDDPALLQQARAEWKGQAEPGHVLIAVSDVPAQPGDSVRIVGSAPELGAWNPARAPEVPPGKSHLDLTLPAGSVSEFKLVVVGPNQDVRWEDRQNRVLFVRAGDEPIALDLQWDERDGAKAERE